MKVPMEVAVLHVHRVIVLLHVWLSFVALLQCSKKTMWLHVESIVLLCAAVEISLRDNVLLKIALEVVLLHALNVLAVADVEALMLLPPTSRVLLPRVGMEITPILPLCHLGTAATLKCYIIRKFTNFF